MDIELTKEVVRDLFEYEPETGFLIRRKSAGTRSKIGDAAGTHDKYGYRTVQIANKKYFVHRVVWLHVHGQIPVNVIDHINGIKDDNRLSNLRDVTSSENCQNLRKAKSHNKSGLQGVSWDFEKSKWRTQITIDGRAKFLGRFETKELAYECYLEAKRRLHTTCTI
jgi:hypothetical protein